MEYYFQMGFCVHGIESLGLMWLAWFDRGFESLRNRFLKFEKWKKKTS